jgi:hypothetical protein
LEHPLLFRQRFKPIDRVIKLSRWHLSFCLSLRWLAFLDCLLECLPLTYGGSCEFASSPRTP